MYRHGQKFSVLACLAWFAVACAHTDAPAEAVSPTDIARAAAALLARDYASDGPGAAVLVARGDVVLFRGARGETDGHAPLRPDSVFRIGSMTKQFTAAGLLTLVEAGRVKLDDPLSLYLPQFPGGDRITLLELLNHTSGVRNYSNLPNYASDTIRRDFTTAEIIDLFKNEAPEFAPGSQWAYSNSGYLLLGAVIEAVTGMPWHAYLEQTFFRPLGMNHTGYGHDPRFAALQVAGYSYDGETRIPALPLSMTQPHAAGALVSNVDDLLKWNRALHEGRLLNSAAYTQMITPVGPAAESAIRYGFGLFNDQVRGHFMLQHGGRIFGFISALSYMPGPDITVVVLENDDARNGVEEGDALARRLTALALGEPYPAMIALPVEAAALAAAEGVYRFDADVTRTLRLVDGNLTAQRDDGRRTVLTPIAADDFLYSDGFNRLKLERDAGGAITGMRFFANGDGGGDVGVRIDQALPATPATIELSRAAMERLVGGYANNEVSLTVFIEGGALKAQIEGQPPVGLRAASQTLFDVEETGASVEFVAGDAPASQLTIRQGGREAVLRRLDPG